MIQRIQTVYLCIAALLMIVCACLPIGEFIPEGMGTPSEMYNLCIIDGTTGNWNFSVCGLFALLAAGVITTVINIFNYKNLRAQSISCLGTIIIMLLWIGLYFFEIKMMAPENTKFHFSIIWMLPLFAILCLRYARRGIKKDQALLRSVDRIR